MCRVSPALADTAIMMFRQRNENLRPLSAWHDGYRWLASGHNGLLLV
jgi:hypothetical protein